MKSLKTAFVTNPLNPLAVTCFQFAQEGSEPTCLGMEKATALWRTASRQLWLPTAEQPGKSRTFRMARDHNPQRTGGGLCG